MNMINEEKKEKAEGRNLVRNRTSGDGEDDDCLGNAC
jgi:hypothetical protein